MLFASTEKWFHSIFPPRPPFVFSFRLSFPIWRRRDANFHIWVLNFRHLDLFVTVCLCSLMSQSRVKLPNPLWPRNKCLNFSVETMNQGMVDRVNHFLLRILSTFLCGWVGSPWEALSSFRPIVWLLLLRQSIFFYLFAEWFPVNTFLKSHPRSGVAFQT